MKTRQQLIEELKAEGINPYKFDRNKTCLVDTVLAYYKQGFEHGFKTAEDQAYKTINGYKFKQ